jgi:hypothetical protein
VPFFPQRDYQCGPAALAMSLAASGIPATTEELIPRVYLPERRGSLQVEMLAAARRYGVVSYTLAPKFEDVLREVAAGTPVVVLQNYGVWPVDIWHYAVLAGYDYPAGEVMLRSGEKERLTMPFPVFEYLWKKSDYWAMVTVPPGRIPVTAVESAYAQAVAALEHAGQPGASARAYAALLERWPHNLTAAVGLANIDHAAGRLQAAEVRLRQALEHHPGSVVVLNNLAQTLSDAGRHEEALSFIDRAIALGGPFSSAAADTRSTIVQRMTRTSADTGGY